MMNDILDASKSDVHLDGLLDEARECARVYLLAQKTYKGFEGMGEVVTLKEELKDALDKMFRYYSEKKHLPDNFGCDDIDATAKALLRSDRK